MYTPTKKSYRIARRAGYQGARPSVDSQTGVEKYATGCDSLSLSSRKLQEANVLDQYNNQYLLNKTATHNNSKNSNFNHLKIATLNKRTLICDIKLANAVQSAQSLGLDIFALQEVRRSGDGHITFSSESLNGWQFIWLGFKFKHEAGVGFILAPHVKVINIINNMPGRIISIQIVVNCLRLNVTNVYSPTNVASGSSKDLFYRELYKTEIECNKSSKFKSIVLGDFNATIGMNSKLHGAWDKVLGFNNSDLIDTNDNGDRFLKFCLEHKLHILNTIFRSKRIHRNTWLHAATGTRKRIDYITTRGFLFKLTTSCRVYNGATKLFDTDHSILVMSIKSPIKMKSFRFKKCRTMYQKNSRLNLAVLRDAEVCANYSAELNTDLNPESLPKDQEQLVKCIENSVYKGLHNNCPNIQTKKISEPWLDDILQDKIKLLKSAHGITLRALKIEIKSKRKELKNKYYKRKSDEVNSIREARAVENEFKLAKKYKMFSGSTGIKISKEKLTKHFTEHFASRSIETPSEIKNPEDYPYLKNTKFLIDESIPKEKEIDEIIKSFKNNKSPGTDNVPNEGLKYQTSKNLLSALIILLASIWNSISIPKLWKESKITCLFKKGEKHLPKNYRALSVGSNLSKILPALILKRINESYENNISETQFGFRKGRSTCDAIFIVRNIIKKHSGMLIATFIDLTAAYDHIPRDFLFRVLEFRTGAQFLVHLLSELYHDTTAYISGTKTKFNVNIGCRQGGLESPTLFNYYFDFVLGVCAHEIDRRFPDGWGIPFSFNIPNQCTNRQQRADGKMNGLELIKWILYADDLVLFSSSLAELNTILEIINSTCKRFGLTISFKKTKTMVFGDLSLSNEKSIISIEGNKIENVDKFCYLGHTIFIDQKKSYTDLRISSALSKFSEMGNVLRDGEVDIGIRRKLLESCVRPRLLYATQSWCPYEAEILKLQGCWYGCLRKMVRNGYRRKREINSESFAFRLSNSDLEKIIGTPPIRDFLNVSYLNYIAHVCRNSNKNLTKISMFIKPECRYYRDPWIKIAKLLGGLSIDQAKRETQSRAGFHKLLIINYPFLCK